MPFDTSPNDLVTPSALEAPRPAGRLRLGRSPWGTNPRADLRAALLQAVALVPEAIAFSVIAGLGPKVGLYASFSIAVTIVGPNPHSEALHVRLTGRLVGGHQGSTGRLLAGSRSTRRLMQVRRSGGASARARCRRRQGSRG